MVVETDYIICVVSDGNQANGDGPFPPFTISKTFRAVRELSTQLKHAAKAYHKKRQLQNQTDGDDPRVLRLLAHIHRVTRLVGKQKTQYLGKVTYTHVKSVAKKRANIINQVLAAILEGFPSDISAHPFFLNVTEIIELFFLTDYCEETPITAAPGSSGVSLSSFLANAVLGTASSSSTNGGNSVSENSRRSHRYTKSGEMHKIAAAAVMSPTKSNVTSLAEVDVGVPLLTLPPPTRKQQQFQQQERSQTPIAVHPYTRKNRRSLEIRDADQRELNQSRHDEECWTMNDDREKPQNSNRMMASRKTTTANVVVQRLEAKPAIGLVVAAGTLAVLWVASLLELHLRSDTMLVLLVAAFSVGRQWDAQPPPTVEHLNHRPQRRRSSMSEMRRAVIHSHSRRNSNSSSGSSMRQLLRQSMVATTPTKSLPTVRCSPAEMDLSDHEMTPTRPSSYRSVHSSVSADEGDMGGLVDDAISTDDPDPSIGLPCFPLGASLGSHLNCWSMPDHKAFQVRGPRYLQDRKKVPSEPFVFRARGTDLFLTDICPEHAATNSNIFGGKLRDAPTFLINFRLPWGVLLAYYEIPAPLVPFLRARYEPDFDKSILPPISSLSPSDRCVAQFLQGSDTYRNQILKIVPMVVAGPWVVKAAAGGKPAILGTKMPVRYFYGKPENSRHPYLEADLDIVASSAARGILSVARKYTQLLTIDLGFVIEGRTPDELPERMLSGTRLHGIDPLSAPVYPDEDPTDDDEDDNDEDEVSNDGNGV